MTKKRFLVVAGLLASLLGIGLGIPALIPSAPSRAKMGFDRIEMGMTKRKIQEILANDCTEHPYWSVCCLGADGNVVVRFDHNDRAITKIWVPNPPESLAKKIRRWFQLG